MSLLIAVALFGSGCAFITTTERSETISDSSGPTSTTATSDKTDSGPEADENDTAPGEAISTSEEPAETDESFDRVPARAETNELRATIREILGPTTDVSAGLNRLFPYPDIPTPAGAHLRDLSSDMNSNDDGTLRARSDGDFYADGSVDDLVVFYQTQLPPLGWKLTNTSSDTDFAGNPTTELDFELEGEDEFQPETLKVTLLESATLTKILVRTAYRTNAVQDLTYLDSFNGWYDTDLAPDNGELVGASVSTLSQDLTTSIALRTYFEFADRDGSELIADLGERANDLSLEIEKQGEDAGERWVVSAAPNYPRFDYYNYTLQDGIVSDNFELSIVGGFAILPTYLDPAALPDDLRKEPLNDLPNIYEIEAIMRQMSGRTADVSEQMNRLAPFPEVPTPEGTSIFSTGFNLREGSLDETTQRYTWVGMLVRGNIDDLLIFHETQFAALGWSEESRTDGEPDDGRTKTTIEFALPSGVQDGTSPAFQVDLWDDEETSYVEILWTYGEKVSADLNSMGRWLGWQGTLPFRAGRVPESLQIDENSLSSSGLQVTATYRFENPAEVVMSQVESRVASSDYSLAPEPASLSSHLDLVHPDFQNISLLFNNGIDNESTVIFVGSRPYLAEGVELIFEE